MTLGNRNNFIQKDSSFLCEDGIMLIDKPAGITSFDVIRALRRRCGIRRIGHGGTLDPMATGLLVIGIGAGTKQLKDVIGLQKTYESLVLFGIRTTTGDLEGSIEESKDASVLQEKDILQAISRMRGVFSLRVPRYSAVKQGGIPLYRLARTGKSFVPPIREMKVINTVAHSVRLGARAEADIEWEVESGVYIRSLAEELGRRLGSPATLASLRRTRVGDMRIEDAISYSQIVVKQEKRE